MFDVIVNKENKGINFLDAEMMTAGEQLNKSVWDDFLIIITPVRYDTMCLTVNLTDQWL